MNKLLAKKKNNKVPDTLARKHKVIFFLLKQLKSI